MASIWEANDDIKRKLKEVKDLHHPHLSMASIWLLCSDGKAIRDNRIIATTTQKCTTTEKLSSGHDFKITIMMEAWAHMTDVAREVALDEALCRCGVKYVPEKLEINGKKEVVKDELGRIIYTGEIDYDKEGNPKWKVNRPDSGLYFDLLMRRGQYNEEVENAFRALDNKPLKGPIAAERKDMIEMVIEADPEEIPV